MLNENAEVCLIKGDGIGPEISDAVIKILDAASANIAWVPIEAGLGQIDKHGVGILPETMEIMREKKTTLKGPTTTPVGGGHRSINVTIRKALDLYVNVRPSKDIPGVDTRYKDFDMIIVRENIEDTYGGIEYWQSEDQGICLRLATRSGAERAHRYAFEMAQKQGRKTVTCAHKANIMKITDGMWLEEFKKVAKEYPEIESNDIIVDNLCMQLVTKPSQFDVIVLPNLFGDIVSDLCAGLMGGLGVASGANIGKDVAVFEAVHGSAPDIAGQGLANPTAMLTSAISMLKHLGKLGVADKVEKALSFVLMNPKMRTKDLGGPCGTEEFTKHIINEIGKMNTCP